MTPMPVCTTLSIGRHRRPSKAVSIHRQREAVDNGSDHPGENLTNNLDVQTCVG